jgi:ubiquinone/menaquinone biosynthesis C-methylase UbiE
MMQEIIEKARSCYSGNDAEFFSRVWEQGLDAYTNRLKAIGFVGHEKILDAGFGMAQWLVALSFLNREVHGIEYAENRVECGKLIIREMNIDNVVVSKQSVESMSYEDESFDAIFCYGVALLTDYKRTIKEFYRVLKHSGKLYLTSFGVGCFASLIINETNKSKDYDPRKYAIDAIENTILYYASNSLRRGAGLIIPSAAMNDEMKRVGFRNIRCEPEGSINNDTDLMNRSFYARDYMGYENAYEILCEKSA